MSARRNGALKHFEGCTRRRLPALLDLETRAAAVGGSGPGRSLNDDELKEIARHLLPTDLRNASAADKAVRRTAANLIAFAKKYNLKSFPDDWFGLILDISTATQLNTDDGVKPFFNDLSTSSTLHLRVIPNSPGMQMSSIYMYTSRFVLLWQTACIMYTEERQQIKGLKSLDVRYKFNTEAVLNMFLCGIRIFTSLENLRITSSSTRLVRRPREPVFLQPGTSLTKEFTTTLTALRQLKRIDLISLSINDVSSIGYLCDGLLALRYLSSLTVQDCILSEDTWVQLATTLKSTSRLSTLHITQPADRSFRVEVDDSIVEPLKAMFREQHHMTSVSVCGTGLGRACIAALSQVDTASITFLDLSQNVLRQKTLNYGLVEILQSVEFLANVKHLSMRNTGLSHADIPALVTMIERMHNLENINLSGDSNTHLCYFYDVNLDENMQEQRNLFAALSTRTRLQTIKISDVSVPQIEVLYNIVQNDAHAFPKLKLTHITFLRIGDEQINKIVQAVEAMPEHIQNRLKIGWWWNTSDELDIWTSYLYTT